MNGDLFGGAIAWDETGMAGRASDGRRVTIGVSILTQRYVAAIPLHGRDVEMRRSCPSLALAQAAAEKAVANG